MLITTLKKLSANSVTKKRLVLPVLHKKIYITGNVIIRKMEMKSYAMFLPFTF